MKLLLAGYYGCGNVGDDALLQAFYQEMAGTGARIVAMAGNPERLQRAIGVPGIPRRDMNYFTKELESSDALVFAGGGILQDATSYFSIRYYTGLIQKAKKMKKPVFLLAQGIGPVTSMLGKSAASAALKQVDLLTVRDPHSANVARQLGYRGPLEVTADLAWLLQPSQHPGTEFNVAGMQAVAVSARPVKGQKDLAKTFGDFAQMLFRNQFVPVLLEMDTEMDRKLLDEIAKLHGGRCPDIRNLHTPSEMLARIARTHAMVAMRLHAGIFAAKSGIVPLMIAYDPKVVAFCDQAGLPSPVPVQGLSAQRLWDAFSNLERDRASLTSRMQEKTAEMVALARRNVDILKARLNLS
ncbi:MAG: polysaccharide pyruvyl transferase CsaB [Armatimonadetes bacterium]|nr:MAG: polysaccharide pyruvyl transferase CsaB [Armatimonadota bacterium]